LELDGNADDADAPPIAADEGESVSCEVISGATLAACQLHSSFQALICGNRRGIGVIGVHALLFS
jgi:hypothetical protein